MYAVIKTGGKQYRVQEGDVVRVEKLNADIGSEVTFDEVLMIGEGADFKAGSEVADAQVTGVIAEAGRGQKIVVFKKRRRKNYRVTQGHRQSFTSVRIAKIG